MFARVFVLLCLLGHDYLCMLDGAAVITVAALVAAAVPNWSLYGR